MGSKRLSIIWNPLSTLHYFFLELLFQTELLLIHVQQRIHRYFLPIVLMCIFILFLMFSSIADTLGLNFLRNRCILFIYWCGLGILSSIGLGTGLHTFALYLGPFLAKVTMAAYECGSVQFPEPPFPEEVICPSRSAQIHSGLSAVNKIPSLFYSNQSTHTDVVSLWGILGKVDFFIVAWGFGTAIGELPPYFMARIASASIPLGSTKVEVFLDKDKAPPATTVEPLAADTSELGDIVALLQRRQEILLNDSHLGSKRTGGRRWYGNREEWWLRFCHPSFSVWERVQLVVFDLVKGMGFFGILICASVPNPLFDVAGLICGYFSVTFWAFFLPTAIGKTLFKAHFQSFAVLVAFSPQHVHQLLRFIRALPVIGGWLSSSIGTTLEHQRERFHHKTASRLSSHGPTWLSVAWEYLVFAMVLFFILSILQSMARNYLRRREFERGLVSSDTKSSQCHHYFMESTSSSSNKSLPFQV